MKGRKGNAKRRSAQVDPAKRTKSTTTKKNIAAAEQRAAAAQERAAQFVAETKHATMPPFMFEDPQYAGAAAIWKHYEPLLRERNFWEPQFISTFTGFCIYADEFMAADREVKAKGWGVEGKSTSGGNRFWTNPAVAVRDHAFSRVLELGSRFGFTPIDLYKLERESAAAGGGRGKHPGAQPSQVDPATNGELPIPAPVEAKGKGPGSLALFDSQPPPRPN